MSDATLFLVLLGVWSAVGLSWLVFEKIKFRGRTTFTRLDRLINRMKSVSSLIDAAQDRYGHVNSNSPTHDPVDVQHVER